MHGGRSSPTCYNASVLRGNIKWVCLLAGTILIIAYLFGRFTDWEGVYLGQPYIFEHRRNVGCNFDGRHFLIRWSGLSPEPGATPGTTDRVWTHLGVRCEVEPNYVWCGRCITVRVSMWLPALLFAAYPLISIARHIQRRLSAHVLESRRRRGLCTTCGYNLTGNESGVCPECGHSVVENPPSDRDGVEPGATGGANWSRSRSSTG